RLFNPPGFAQESTSFSQGDRAATCFRLSHAPVSPPLYRKATPATMPSEPLVVGLSPRPVNAYLSVRGTRPNELSREEDPMNNRKGRPRTMKVKAVLRGHDAAVRVIAFSPEGRTVATGSEDKNVKLWHTASGKCRGTLQHEASVTSLSFSNDGSVLATG